MKKHAPIHADHSVQRDYPAKVKFCPLCGAAMESRMLMPENAERKVCTRCGFVLFPGPKLVAGCFVVDAGRVLLLRRGIEPAVGKWTFPGGYVDFGENAADAALRETREEVGMRVALGPLLGVFNDSAITVVVYLATPGKEPTVALRRGNRSPLLRPRRHPMARPRLPNDDRRGNHLGRLNPKIPPITLNFRRRALALLTRLC